MVGQKESGVKGVLRIAIKLFAVEITALYSFNFPEL